MRMSNWYCWVLVLTKSPSLPEIACRALRIPEANSKSPTNPPHADFSPYSLRGFSVRMLITMENSYETSERAISDVDKTIRPVGDQSGWRVGRIVDPFGHHWEIGKPLKG